MTIKKIGLVLGLLWTATVAMAQKITPEEYIAQYKDIAIREMKRMGVPAAITLAQGLLETENGNSVLVKKSNNHFGIKCKSSWTAGGVTHDDDAIGECFRQYATAEASYRDHSNFLRGNQRYGFLFKMPVTDYKGWAHGLKKAGYATNPKYPQILIKHIEQYNLQQYTLEGAGEVPVFNSDQYEDDKEEKNGTPSLQAEQPAAVANSGEEEETEAGYSAVYKENGRKAVLGKKGTSLLKIADDHNLRLIKLLEYNGLSADGILQQDQVVYLEPGAAKKKEATTAAKTTKVQLHKVEPKEGLYGIAKKYGVTVQQLREWNNLTTDALNIGQELVVAQ